MFDDNRKRKRYCARCGKEIRRSLPAAQPASSNAFREQHELAHKLGQLTSEEWARFHLVGLPSRLQ